MHLDGLHIDSFGIFRDQGFTGLGAGLSVFLGANESGKSTLLEFVRWTLFGAGDIPPPPPLEGGRTGGRLRLITRNGEVTLVERTEDQTPPSIPCFESLDRRGFERIFALGLDDLQGLDVLSEEEQRGRFQSATQGLGPVDPGKIRQLLTKEIRSTLTQRGTRATVNGAKNQLQDIEERLRQAQDLTTRYARLEREKEDLIATEEQRDQRLRRLDARRIDLDQLRQARQPWDRWREAKQRLESPDRASPLEGQRRTKGSRLSLVIPFLFAAFFVAVGTSLFFYDLLSLTTAGALTIAGMGIGASLHLLLHRGHQRMLRVREVQQLTLEAQRHRSAFEALTEERPDLQARVPDFDEESFEEDMVTLLEEHRQLTRDARVSQHRLGVLDAEMHIISAGEGPEELLLQQQIQKQRLAKGVKRWATAVLSLDIFDEALQSFAEERTPRILKRAGELASSMIGEKLRLVAEPGEPPRLEGSSLARRPPAAWSSGLGDQIYLAARLAFAEELRRDREPLPFLLDDIFVRLDPQRRTYTLRCLLDLTSSRQILLFTSRPSLVKNLKSLLAEDCRANPSAHLVELDRGAFSAPRDILDYD